MAGHRLHETRRGPPVFATTEWPAPATGPHVRGRHGVAELAQTYIRIAPGKPVQLAVPLHCGTPTMTRDQWETWCRLFEGTTIRELRHMRDEPRAYIALPVVQAVARERTQVLRRAS